MVFIAPESITIDNAEEFKDELVDAIEQETDNEEVIIDMGKTKYISSSGLRSFIVINQRLKENERNLRITNLTPETKEMLEVTGIRKVIDVE